MISDQRLSRNTTGAGGEYSRGKTDLQPQVGVSRGGFLCPNGREWQKNGVLFGGFGNFA